MSKEGEVEELIRVAHRILTEVGVSCSPSKVSRIVRSYRRQVERNGFPFLSYLANAITANRMQRDALLTNAEWQKEIELLMRPGNYAGSNHRGTGSIRHTHSGGVA
jgi:hypothetical protein